MKEATLSDHVAQFLPVARAKDGHVAHYSFNFLSDLSFLVGGPRVEFTSSTNGNDPLGEDVEAGEEEQLEFGVEHFGGLSPSFGRLFSEEWLVAKSSSRRAALELAVGRSVRSSMKESHLPLLSMFSEGFCSEIVFSNSSSAEQLK